MKKLAGAAVFLVALGVALLVTSYYDPRPVVPTLTLDPQPDDTPTSRPAFPPPTRGTRVTYKAQLVTLDAAARKSHTTLVVEHAPDAPAPERLWVWTGFFVPGDAGGELFAGEPAVVVNPFASGNRVTVSVSADCQWCGRRDAPAAGYYARVNVSPVSAADARLEDERVSRDITKATPVTVEQGRRRAR